MNENIKIIPLFLLVLILFATVYNGCEQTFEPFQENDRYTFSIYGYLDASADTQWVRIMPVRDAYFLSSDPIDIHVTLETLDAGGEISVLNDSLFYYGQGAYAWNFWTTMQIQPEQTYELKAEDTDGNVSSVRVTLPADFPDPVIEVDLENQEEILLVRDVDNLADVHSVHKLYHHHSDVTSYFTFNHHQDSLSITTQPGIHTVLLNPSEAREYMETYIEQNPYTLEQREIFVASAGPDWHFFPDLSEELISLPDGISNVENGVGYVVGIVSKKVPWEMLCFTDEIDDFGQPVADPCPF